MPLLPPWTPRTTAITTLLVLAVLLCWVPAFNALADRYVDDGFKRSLLSFATARALHSAVSVLQGTELAIQPMGVGLTLTLGQVLAPINDLIAQFADWMLWASIAFGMQKLLLTMGGNGWVTGLVTLVAATWLGLHWQQRAPAWLSKLLVIMLFTRLVMPVTIIGSEWLFTQFLKQPYEQSLQTTRETTEQVQSFDINGPATTDTTAPSNTAEPPTPPEPIGQWERIKNWGNQVQQTAGDTVSGIQQLVRNPRDAVSKKFEQFQQTLEAQVERLITLIVVFALQTIVIPMALIWGLLQLCRGLLGSTRDRAGI